MTEALAARIFELAKERWLEDHDTGLRGLKYAMEDDSEEWRAYVTAAAVDAAREENDG